MDQDARLNIHTDFLFPKSHEMTENFTHMNVYVYLVYTYIFISPNTQTHTHTVTNSEKLLR